MPDRQIDPPPMPDIYDGTCPHGVPDTEPCEDCDEDRRASAADDAGDEDAERDREAETWPEDQR